MVRRGGVMKTIVFDSFNRANNYLGTAETGQAWKSNGSNTTAWNVVSNVAKLGSPSTAFTDAAYIDCGKSDVILNADIRISDFSFGIYLVARMSGTSADNCMALYLGKDGNIRIGKYVSGTWTSLSTAAYSYVSQTTYSCEFACIGNTFNAYLNGALKCTATDDNAFKTNTKVGMYLPCASSSGVDWFDNFSARG